MKKRMLALLMTIVMSLSLLPMSALAAEDDVAQIGETTYATFADALKAANGSSEATTITLLQDCTSDALIQTTDATKNITIDLNSHTLTINRTFTRDEWYSNGYGVKGELTFKNGSIVSAEQNSNGETFTVSATGTLSFKNCSVSIGGNETYTAVYNLGTVNITGGAFTVSNTSGTGDAFYSDNGEAKLNIKNATITIENTSRFDVWCETLIENSTVSLSDLRAIGMNQANTTMRDSILTMDSVVNHGYTNGILKMYNSTMTLNDCGNIGANVKGESLLDNSTLKITNCGGIETSGRSALVVGLSTTANNNDSLTIQNSSKLTVTNNKQGGIYVSGALTQDASSTVTVTNNKITTAGKYNAGKGGGISNIGTVTLQDDAILYNNHASVAGDDIYSTGTITFGPVGSDWALDGDKDKLDCNGVSHAIDGWYDDAEDSRWEAHAKPVHVEEFTDFDEGTGMAVAEGSLALKAAHALTPLDPDDPENENWEISKSKTATNLDKNFESKVTLSLPSAEEKLVTDVVFVLDESSCSVPVKEKVSAMLENLYTQVKDTDASIKIGAVQFRGEVTKLPLIELTEDTKNIVAAFMGERPKTGGSNMSAGLLAGEKMLDADTSVDNNRKYLILVSDGITYIWDDETTEVQENIGVNFANGDTPNIPMLAVPDGWDVKHGRGYVPTDWKTELETIHSLMTETIEKKSSTYVRGFDISNDPFVAYSEKDQYASTVDIAMYKSYEVYQRIASKYNDYVVVSGVETDIAAFPFGPSFMNYLADGKDVSFEDIQKNIHYLLSAGSKVTDVIGNDKDNKGNDYDFDFVNKAENLTLTVGSEKLDVVDLTDPDLGFTNVNETARYGFGESSSAYSGGYPFVLHYYANGEDGNSAECFVWDINVPVTNFERVSLTYTVKLTNPQSASGTYGEYDKDGSAGKTALYTNNSATLYPVDSNGDKGLPENFRKPTVSYTVSSSSGGGGSTKPPVLNTEDHYGYIIGYPVDYYTGEKTNDQTRMPVKPEGNITRAEVATIFFRMLTDESRAEFWSQTSSYSDVEADDWFNNAICTLSNAGIINGYNDGTFKPNGKITRAEFATIASRFFEYADENIENPFSDVEEGAWYYKYIMAASDMGLINGYPDGTFGPEKLITRAEAVTIVNRTLDRHPDQDHFLKDMLVWVDNMDTSKWYYEDMQEATNSHEYEMKGSGDNKYENWTKMLPIRDWAAFEKEWSDANSASGGEVVK